MEIIKEIEGLSQDVYDPILAQLTKKIPMTLSTSWSDSYVYFMKSEVVDGLYKVGKSRWPSERKKALTFNGKVAKMKILAMLRFTAILPNGELSKGEDWREVFKRYAYEDFAPAFQITQDKVKKMEAFFKTKFVYKCVQGAEWFNLTKSDVDYVIKHFKIRNESENDVFTKTELTLCQHLSSK